MKTCTQCHEAKSLDDFYANPRLPDGRFGECKDCNRARAKAWQAAKRAADPNYAWMIKLRSKYGISPEGFAALLAQQGGGCAVCGTAVSGTGCRRMSVDHDHGCCPGERSCGRCIRGILCSGCNTGIGNLGDNPDRLLAAAAYLLARQDVLTSAVF